MAQKSRYTDSLIKVLFIASIVMLFIGTLYVAGKFVYSDSTTGNYPGDLFFQIPIVFVIITLPLYIVSFSLSRLHITKFKLKSNYIIIASIFLMVFTTIGDIGQTYNYFTKQKETIEAKYAEIDIQYQKRFDQIPNIARTAKSFSTFEQNIITQIANSRSAYLEGQTVDEKVKAANMYDANLRSFILTVENYPNLKSDSIYNQLVQSIIQNENEIATVKKEFNTEVKMYNQFANSFPNVIVTRIMGIKEKEYMKSDLGTIMYDSKPLLDYLSK